MKMCTDHWNQLRADISRCGLDHLIAPDGKAAAEMLKRQLENKDGPLDFDPLMNANNLLWNLALNFIGLRVMEEDQCPSCALRDYNWTEGAAHQSLKYAKENGLMLEFTE